MRIKNFTLLFLMGIFGLCTFNAQAQQDAAIDPSQIRYWIGEGQNEVVFIVNWNEPDTALAWGYRFNGESISVKEMMIDIAATDPRFDMDYNDEYNFVNNLKFDDGVVNLSISEEGYFLYNVNGTMSNEYFNAQMVVNGDYVKWGDSNCGTCLDPDNWIFVWEKEVVGVYAIADEATIAPENILYWVGEGENEAILAVNWAEPNMALAWGFRFAGESVTVKEVMVAIANADARFDFEAGDWGETNITYDEGELHLSLVGDYWMYNMNGYMAWYGYDEQTVVNGDFIKWGDIACATEIGQWSYVWTTPVTPVTNNTAVAENDYSLALCPNPASSYTMLSISGTEPVEVTVADLQGRILSSFPVTPNGEAVRIETSNYKAGIYFVTVNGANSRQTVKLSVQ